ncbi:TetR/AcrR family transcriptional regulator [Acinetobacter baumannii]|uniref:TetR/AcrR family transcriptional regulator n=1 Tax=Acinetobacter baumannii TaxID=470 RepID=UPI001DF5AE06|nr:TetR/AcrR family transcriptional regulator [Acinetobacter baumannii]MDC5311150.1 TetR/AcrR family transcriptional regulator [Acinetobacter baumannii]MDN8272014.1 TetR/AcrR family transcriptional regulator [Acinetobacter baumannii]CAI3134396.1 putative HTH-type transcriptional regulator YfiR [Acinetobacter baumannii]CAI3135045.1 putative HTH-type transcriptional regulator YfiR [Acinetobacter baumannii]
MTESTVVKRKRSPSLEKTQATKEAILKVARIHFAEVGFAKAKVSDIAKNANIANGTIYSYFKTKEELFEGVIEDILQQDLRLIRATDLQENQTVYSFLLEHLDKIVSTVEKSGRDGISRLVLKEGENFPNIKQIYFQRVLSPYLVEFEKLIQIAIERKEIAPVNAKEFSLLLIAPTWMGVLYNGMLQDIETTNINNLFRTTLYALFHTNFHKLE